MKKKKLIYFTLVILTITLILTACGSDSPSDIEENIASYSLDVSKEGQGTISLNPDKNTFTNGETVEITAEAKEGWKFTGWEGAVSNTSEKKITLVMDSNYTLKGIFREINNSSPTINLSINTDKLELILEGAVTDDEEVKEVIISWGDGNNKTINSGFNNIIESHTYTDEGEYRVNVKAKDNNDNLAEDSFLITVKDKNNLLSGSAIKYYHDEHDRTTVNLRGTSDDGYAVERQTETNINGNFNFFNVPNGSYEVSFANFISGNKYFHNIEESVTLNNKDLVLDVKIPFHFETQIINAVGRDGINFSSLTDWVYTTNKEEADVYLENGNLITPNRNAIQVLDVDSITTYPNLHDYSLKGINEVPVDGYTNSVSFAGTKIIAFKTKNGNYGKGYIDSGHLQWVLTPDNTFEW